LLQLIQKLQSCDFAVVIEKENESEFESPQKIYEYCIGKFINELEGDKIFLVLCTHTETRKRKLKVDIIELNQKITNLQDKSLHKQKKLSSLEDKIN
jgi:hypothetical protein